MKKISFLIALAVMTIVSRAQSLNDPNTTALPSVNNQFFVSNTGVNVNLYTGTATVSVPLFTLDSKELKIPIGLSYADTRGIRVQDVANYVGLGWKLNAAGSVTRIVRGLPDDITNGYIGITPSANKVITAAGNGDATTLQQIGHGTIDGEPDIFCITTPFFTFQFVFDENGNPVFPNNSGFKVQHNLFNNVNYLSTSWTITDDQGNQYFFGSTASSRENTTTKLYNTNYTFISSWYLDKIVSYNNVDQITYNYTSGPDYSISHNLVSQTTISYGGNVSGDPTTTTTNTTTTATYNSPKYVSSIISSLGEVDFTYIFDRRDVTTAGRLLSFAVYAFIPGTTTKGNQVKSYQFDYSYFGDPSSNPDQLRLKLDNIILFNNLSFTSVPPLVYKSFDYNMAYNLPARSSVEFDYWGYYNTNTSGTTLVPNANKAPDINRMAANILTAVHDISGEIEKLDYEPNDYYDNTLATNVPGGGLRVSKQTKSSPAGDNIYTQYVYTDDAGKSTGQVYSTNYKNLTREVLNSIIFCLDQSTGIWGVCGYEAATITVSEDVYNTYDLNGVSIGYSTVKALNQTGGYTKYTFTNFSDFPDNQLIYPTPKSGYQTGSPNSLCYKRGLLLDKTISYSNGNKIAEEINTYGALNQTVLNKAYGISPIPEYTDPNSWNVGWTDYNVYSTNVENYVLTQTTEKTFDQTNQALFSQMVMNYTYAPNKRLVQQVSYQDSKQNPRTEILYHADDANIPWVTSDEQTAINNMVAANRTNVLVHKIELNNGWDASTHNSFKSFVDANFNNKVFVANTTKKFNTGIEKKVQFNYDVNNSNLTSMNPANAPASSTLQGYNQSYVKAMVKNAVNSTFYSTSQGTRSGIFNLPPNTWGTQVVTFTSNYAGTITISIPAGSFLAGGVSVFVSLSLLGPVNQGGNICINSASGYTCSASSSISFNNMPAGTYTLDLSPSTNTATSQVPISYSYPGYQLTTQGETEFFFEDFEENSSATYGNSHTGNYYWNGNYTTSYTPPNGRSYTIQWWNLANGAWLFNQADYHQGATLTGPVDDIRVFPSDGQMETFTYLPLIGMTSRTDPSGKTTYYSYDAFNKLKLITDQDKNILQEYDYQYQVQPVYYNNLQQNNFIKNNCGVGYVGSSVTYTVPASTYNSKISQADADQQALNDITANGQNYANANGTCTPSNSTPTIISLTPNSSSPLSIIVSFTSIPGCQTVLINCADVTMNQTLGSNAGGCTSTRTYTFDPSYVYSHHTFRFTITVFPGNITSAPMDVTIPF